MKILTIGGIVLAVLGLVFVAGLVVLNRTQGGRPVGSPNLAAGTLAPCPDSPNCVSTRAPREDERHHVAPIPVGDIAAGATPNPAEVLRRVAAIIENQPRMKIVEQGPSYLRATATSKIFRFVDDIDFLVDSDEEMLHMRSASRVGEGDMGVNRARYEFFREALKSGLE
ncbi:MAG TPA: DUF1499 domain-containing protein [Alkalispirochaeta sp.]|nr:DUF1499 domain-containing protein [Alkalispirochaeta sp.]